MTDNKLFTYFTDTDKSAPIKNGLLAVTVFLIHRRYIRLRSSAGKNYISDTWALVLKYIL